MSTTEMLEDLGHHVIGANSGLLALDIIKSEKPIDLMVTDHVIPGMTGIELAAASRRLRPSLPDPARHRPRRPARGRATRPAAAGKTLSPRPTAATGWLSAGVTSKHNVHPHANHLYIAASGG
jgi:CheY-like chemotaxis protein